MYLIPIHKVLRFQWFDGRSVGIVKKQKTLIHLILSFSTFVFFYKAKAQSELVGDRKRRAEMARPRFGGVTNWITGISSAIEAMANTQVTDDLSGAIAGLGNSR